MSAIREGPFKLSIPSAGTLSGRLSALLSPGQVKIALGALVGLNIEAPATLTNAVTVMVATPEVGTLSALNISGTNVVVPAASTIFVHAGGWEDIALQSAGAEAAQRDFLLTFQLELTG